jgi:REP element-mobilizing transposase RayT
MIKDRPHRLDLIYINQPIYFVTFATRDRRSIPSMDCAQFTFQQYAHCAKGKFNVAVGRYVIMPDPLHALLSFARGKSMSEVIRGWKRFHTRANHVMWQEGYFDHRLRADERGTQLSAKLNYIRQNPVAAGLCARAKESPWVIDPFAREQGGSACPQDDAS